GGAARLELGKLLVIGRDVGLVDLDSRLLGEGVDIVGQAEIVPGTPHDLRRRGAGRSPGQGGARCGRPRRRKEISTLKPESHVRSLCCEPSPASHRAKRGWGVTRGKIALFLDKHQLAKKRVPFLSYGTG